VSAGRGSFLSRTRGILAPGRRRRARARRRARRGAGRAAGGAAAVAAERAGGWQLGVLGSGGFGTVLAARHRIDGQLYAVKRIRIKPVGMDEYRARAVAQRLQRLVLSEVRNAKLRCFADPPAYRCAR